MKLLLRLIIVFLFCMGSVGAQYRIGYDIFNLDPKEPIDQKKVTKALRAFSLIYHPDKIEYLEKKFPESEQKKAQQIKECGEAAFKFGDNFLKQNLDIIKARLGKEYYWFLPDYSTIPDPEKIGKPKEPIEEEKGFGLSGMGGMMSRFMQPVMSNTDAEKVSKYLQDYIKGFASVSHEESSTATAITLHRKLDIPKLVLGTEELTWDECVFRIIVWRSISNVELLSAAQRKIYEHIPGIVLDLTKKILGIRGYKFACLDRTQFAGKSREQLAAIIDEVRQYKNKTLSYSEEDLKK